MGIPVIRLSSVTYAIRGQKLLEQRGIKSYMKKLTRGLHVKGCGHGLEIHGDVHAAVDILRRADIRVLEVAEI
jgi:hypothetical protein